jgi:hypothetical protein
MTTLTLATLYIFYHCAPGRLSWPPKLRNKLFLPLWEVEVGKNIHFTARGSTRLHSQLVLKNICQFLILCMIYNPSLRMIYMLQQEFRYVHFGNRTDFKQCCGLPGPARQLPPIPKPPGLVRPFPQMHMPVLSLDWHKFFTQYLSH